MQFPSSWYSGERPQVVIGTYATPLAGVVPALLHYEHSKSSAKALEPLGQARVAFVPESHADYGTHVNSFDANSA